VGREMYKMKESKRVVVMLEWLVHLQQYCTTFSWVTCSLSLELCVEANSKSRFNGLQVIGGENK